MAKITSHLLSAADGSHAAGVGVSLARLEPDGSRTQVFCSNTDVGGRLDEHVEISDQGQQTEFELAFEIGTHFASAGVDGADERIVQTVVIRFRMADPDKRYHFPLIISPNGCSSWWQS